MRPPKRLLNTTILELTRSIPSVDKEAETFPITATMVRFNTGDEQSSSRFFTKLNADVRREIFIHLYGSRHVHVMFANSHGVNGHLFWRHEHPPFTHVGWLHCVCKSGAKLPPHVHDECTHRWRFLSTNILWTCKRAYEEGIALLYNTNTLLFEQSIDVVNFNTIAIDHMRFIRSLELHITLGQQDSWGKETDAFRLAVSTLRDWDTWHRCKPVKICVFGELDDAPPKRQKQKVRRDAQREFTRAVRALVENVDVQVYLNDKDDKEIIQPRLLRDIPGLTFADSSEHFPDRRREEDRDVDSDFEGSFHMAVERVFRAGG